MLKVHFKHEDTHWLVFLVVCYSAAVTGAWFWVGEGAVYVAIGAAIVLLLGMQMHLHRKRQEDDVQHLEHVQSLFALYALLEPRAPLPALTRWSATPALASTLAARALAHRPQQVVEFGSGASTIVLAYALDQLGAGHVTTLEHDALYAEASRRALAEHGLTHRATVVHAPLVPVMLDGQAWTWYDPAALDDCAEIDMVVIDGPPKETQALARYPALPVLLPRMTSQCVVLLHDAHRHDERQILDRWQAAYPQFHLEVLPTPKGIAVLVPLVEAEPSGAEAR